MERTRVKRIRGLRLGRLALSTLGLWLPLTGLAFGQTSVTEVVERANPSVVQVSVMFEAGGSRGGDAVYVSRPGSGVALNESGLVLTNAHLVAEISEGSDEYWLVVHLAGGWPCDARVVARDERVDLALLQVELPHGAKLRPLPLADLEGREPGERVVALSWADSRNHYAFAGALAFSAGPVKLRDAMLEPEEVLLSDARFHDLLDGGPLIDTRGRILGIHNSSHLSDLPPDFDEPEEPELPGDLEELLGMEKKVSTDYAVIVSSEAIRTAFGKFLEEEVTPAIPLSKGPPEEATVAIQTIAPSVVSVWTGAADEYPEETDPADPHAQRLPATLGSGVVVDPAGLVLTSADLFEDDVKTAICRLPSGESYPAKLLEQRPSRKVALLSLELPEGTLLPAAALADSTQAMPGEFVAVVGRPFGSTITLSVGVLSALERKEFNPAAMGGIHFVQLASWVHSGHWGGALVDRTGRLMGIAVPQPPGTDGVFEESYLGFASPIAGIREAFQEVWAENGSTGGLPDPVAYSESEVELRKGSVARVAERTLGSLLAVHVSKAVEKKDPGYSPFDEPERTFQMLGQGSGVIIDESGLVLSNWHVVDAAMIRGGGQNPEFLVEVKLSDGRKYPVDVLSTSQDDDLSLLAIRLESGDTVKPIELGDSDALIMGEPVVAIGNPHGLSDSVSAGIISCTKKDVRIQGRARKYKGMVMTDAAINPGNSGGALLDLQGRLVGINSAGRTGLGMAIPVNKAREVFKKLIDPIRLGSAYLGLSIEEVEGRVVVTWIDPFGPASPAKLMVGDRLLRLGEEEVTTGVAFSQVLLAAKAGVPTPLIVKRDGEELTLEITPLSNQAWKVFQQCGIEVTEVDYAEESFLVKDASVALYQAYAEDPSGTPTRLMTGALRVTRAYPLESRDSLDILPGDLLLGMTVIEREFTGVSRKLERFESVVDLHKAFSPLATGEGSECECWLLRDGEIHKTKVFVQKPQSP